MRSSHVRRALVCGFALALSASTFAQGISVQTAGATAPGVRTKMGEIEFRGKVVELDLARRTAILSNAKGEVVGVDIPPEMKNFDEVKVGDDLILKHSAAAVVALEPTSTSGIRERVESSASAAGATSNASGVASQRTVEVLVVIKAINLKARTVTLRGTKRTVTLEVPPSIDLKKLKVGDEVRASLVESVVLSVQRAPAAAAKP